MRKGRLRAISTGIKMADALNGQIKKVLNITVIIASLGYFIDMFDFLIFNIQRVKSLSDLGLSGADLTHAGLLVSNCQLAGLIVGAYFSGIISDKLGRKTSLFLSIIIYSLGSIACAFVHHVPAYGLARFAAGLGLAGELGSGAVIIAEKLGAAQRGRGVMIFMGMGFLGVCTAAVVSNLLPWRVTYIVGGLLGISLLLTRALLTESHLFEQAKKVDIVRGGLRLILRDKEKLKKYLCAIAIMLPAVFAPQILWTLSPELGKAAGVTAIKGGTIICIGFAAGILFDLISINLSEKFKSRRLAGFVSLALFGASLGVYFLLPSVNLTWFYASNFFSAAGFGLWVVGAVWAAESFGTNIRATAVTTIPNFARGAVILMNIAYGQLKFLSPLTAAGSIGLVIFLLSTIGWYFLPETYGKNLNFLEE